MENNLPERWSECSLGEILTSKKGKKPSTVIQEPKTGYVPYILIDEMEGNPIRNYTNDPKVSIIDESEVLLVWDGSIGKCGSGMSGAIGSTLVGLKALGGIQTKFLEYLIKHQNNFIRETSTGTGLQHINKDFFEICKIALPPLAEQHRIVAKLDALFEKIESNKKRLENIPIILKRFRQSVLAAAVSGKLTNNLTDDSFPSTWGLLYGNQVFEFITSGSRGWASYYSETGKLFIRVTNLDFDTITINTSLSKNKYVNPPKNAEGTRTRVKANDILISITGDVGMVGMVEEGFEEAYINQHVCLARPKTEYNSKYIAHYISALNGGRKYFDDVKKGATKSGLVLGDIKQLPIPIPSADEQKEIVKRIEQLFDFADKLEARYTKAKAMLDKMPQSILAKAFRGELVNQDPNDESASVLLDKIKQEKDKLKAVKKRKQK